MGTAYLSAVSRFDSTTALWAILLADLAITSIHILQEWRGEEVPLWRVLGAIKGVCVPHRLGFASFTLGLAAVLWLAGVVGVYGVLGLLWGMIALGFIIGGRISDCVMSHWHPYVVGYRPNPGLSSTLLYIIEAVFLLWAFWTGLSANPYPALLGIAFGAGLFIAVQPSLRALRNYMPAWQRDPWLRRQPIPAWARLPDCSTVGCLRAIRNE
jgi:hypothetical protein